MKKILSGKLKYLVLLIYAVLGTASVFLLFNVKTNYDLSKYLPKDSQTKKAITIIENEFGYPSTIDIMVDDVTVLEAKNIKEKIKAVEGVKSVLWLDDAIDINQPISQINEAYLKQFYRDNSALYTVELTTDSYSLETEATINRINKALTSYDPHIRGEALGNIEMRNITNKEISTIMIVMAPLCVLILVFASKSYFEPVLILANLGMAVLLNMGTNILLGEISYITVSMSSVLILAMSMDYSIFLIHRYYELREKGANVIDAVVSATKQAFSSVTASALTTVMGFVALFFMRYTIGKDIGLVLAKGILISFISTITLLPIMILLSNKILDKTQHKNILPSFGGIGKYLNKFRYVIFIILASLAVVSYNLQSKVLYNYGSNQASQEDSKVALDKEAIKAKYGIYNPVLILIPKDNINEEIKLATELENYEYITSVQGLVTLVDPSIPQEFIPSSVRSQFVSENYSRIIVNVKIDEESELMYKIADDIESIVSSHFDEYYLGGIVTSTNDIKKTIIDDSLTVTLFSIISIALVILILFKSLSLPVILVGVIQTSVWINMAIPYLQGSRLAYVGYLVVSSLQLGATIDYAVLLSSRYIEFRQTNDKLEAVKLALNNSTTSIIISSLILTIAGFSEGIISQITAVKDMGNLIGRGALLSGVLVIFVLPSLMLLFDKFVMKLTFTNKKEVKENEAI
jgi:hypothetical protein